MHINLPPVPGFVTPGWMVRQALMLIRDYRTWGASPASHWKSDDVMITREVLIYFPNCFLGLWALFMMSLQCYALSA